MKINFLIICQVLLLIPLAMGQICDDFEDSDFTNNPMWTGDVGNFLVNEDFRLQLNAPEAGNSTLQLDVEIPSDAEWNFFVNLDFAPSSSNQLRIYLAADEADMLGANGYFLEIGTSGSDDPITLYRQDVGSKVKIGESIAGIVGSEPVNVRLKVTKNADGFWNISGDLNGGNNLLPLFSTIDFEYSLIGDQWFGFYCRYSATRVDKFFFDDICIGPLANDTIPPKLISSSVLSGTALSLEFDEALLESSVDPSNFILTPGNVVPSNVNHQQNTVTLMFGADFDSGTEYTLEVKNVSDLSNNVIIPTSVNFTYYEVVQTSKFDLLINEIMADPSPVISLPDAEYLEIFHNGNFTANLSDISLKVGNSTVNLPNQIINPGEFVILVDSDEAQNFESFGTVVPIQLPNLTNSGTSISLINEIGNTIHSISYESSWYQDPDKDNGGWSLELENPLNICFQKENWRASVDLRGGTPGTENAILNVDLDVNGPILIKAIPFDDMSIDVEFNEEITDENLFASSYTLTPDLMVGMATKLTAQSVRLNLAEPMAAGVIYTLQVNSIADCQGNFAAETQTIEFGLPSTPQPGELVINEILFNPKTGGARFIELLNNSEQVLSTEGLVIGEIEGSEADLKSVSTRQIILPNGLIVITPDPEDIKSRYTVPNTSLMIESNLPGWASTSGNATILFDGITIDSFDFRNTYHSTLLDDENGVSLERIDPDLPSNESGTWQSAAQDVGFATPTGENSQVLPTLPGNSEFELVNSTFSPDQDGSKDFLGISFTTPVGESVVSVTIYDASGRRVRSLVTNESVSRNPFIKWDGTDDDGQLSRVGIYVVFVDLFSPNGVTKQYKEACVLAQKLN